MNEVRGRVSVVRGADWLLQEERGQGAPRAIHGAECQSCDAVSPLFDDDSLPAAVDYRRDLAALGQAQAPPGGWPAHLPEGSSVGFEGYLNARLMLAVLRAMPDPDDRRGLDAAARAASPADIGLDAPVFLDGPSHQALRGVYLFTAAKGALAPLETVFAAGGD